MLRVNPEEKGENLGVEDSVPQDSEEERSDVIGHFPTPHGASVTVLRTAEISHSNPGTMFPKKFSLSPTLETVKLRF